MAYSYQNMPQDMGFDSNRGMNGYAEYQARRANPQYRGQYMPQPSAMQPDPVMEGINWASEAGYNMSQRDPDNSLQSAYDNYAAQQHGMNDNTDARLLALQQEKASLEKEIATLQREVNRMQSDVDFAKKYGNDPLYKAAVETYVRTGNMGDLNTFRQYQDALAQRGQAERVNRETWLAKYGAAQRTLDMIGDPTDQNRAVHNAAMTQRDEAERQLRLMGVELPQITNSGKMSVSLDQYKAKLDGLNNASEIDKLVKEIERNDNFKSGGEYLGEARKLIDEGKKKASTIRTNARINQWIKEHEPDYDKLNKDMKEYIIRQAKKALGVK